MPKCDDFIGGLTKFLFQQSPDPARLRLWQEREREGEREIEIGWEWKVITLPVSIDGSINRGLLKWIEQSSEICIERGTERNTREEKEEELE